MDVNYEQMNTETDVAMEPGEDEENDSAVTRFVKSTLSGLGVKKSQKPKTAVGVFSSVMELRLYDQKEIEVKRLKLDEEKLNYTRLLDNRKWEIDRERVNDFMQKKLIIITKLQYMKYI